MLHLVSTLVLSTALALTPADSAELRREALMTALRSGGYTVVLRHARTDYGFKEVMGAVPKLRSEQRNLSDDGIRDAALMGVVFRRYGVTFAEVLSSPMYRAVETAEMAFGKPSTTMALRTFPAPPEQAALIRTPPKRGTNRLLVTHHFVIETHVPGIRGGDIGESEAAVVRHMADGKIELAGRITLADWRMLANPGATAAAPAATPTPATSAHGQSAADTRKTEAKIPDTAIGRLARDYIAAFNTGNVDRMRAFLETSMVADVARPTDERVKSFARIFADHGPLVVSSVDSADATQVSLGITSKLGAIRMTVKTSDVAPTRLGSVTFAIREGAHR